VLYEHTIILMTSFAKTDRNRLRRHPSRGHYDRATIYPIIDEALLCFVGFEIEGQPFVIPSHHGRAGDHIFMHGSLNSRLMQHIAAGHPVSIAIAMIDSLVLARSMFSHSVNYRSVVLFGRGRLLQTRSEKMRALRIISEHLTPGRWDEARQPSDKELDATAVADILIESATAKIRSGPPADQKKDTELPVWAGLVPIRQQMLAPIPAPDLAPDIPLSDTVLRWLSTDTPDDKP